MLLDAALALQTAGMDTAIGIAARMAPIAIKLALALLTLFAAMRSLKLMVSPTDTLAEFIFDCAERIILMMIILFVVEAEFYKLMVKSGIWDLFQYLVGQVAGTDQQSGIKALLAAMDNLRTTFWRTTWEAMLKAGDGRTWTAIIVAFQLLGTLLAAIVSAVILWVAEAIIIAGYCSGIVMFLVGAAIGPLFCAGLILERTEGYFWSWLRFMLVACTALLVAVIVIKILQGALAPYIGVDGSVLADMRTQRSATEGAPLGYATDVAGKLIVWAFFIAYMVSQSTEIANALFSGNTSSVRSGLAAASGGAKQALRGTGAGVKFLQQRILNTPKPPPIPKPGGNDGGGKGQGTVTSTKSGEAATPSSSSVIGGTPKATFGGNNNAAQMADAIKNATFGPTKK
ncbi:MAG: type IV secretion system protein [Burkholderiales bacterium]